MIPVQTARQVITGNLEPWAKRQQHRPERDYTRLRQDWTANGWGAPARIGYAMQVAQEHLTEASTRADWAEVVWTHMLSPEAMLAQMNQYALHHNMHLRKAINYWWLLAVDNCWIGYQEEQAVYRLLQQEAAARHFEVRHATVEEDRRMGADFVLERAGAVIGGVQVKSEYFFLSSAPAVVHDREVRSAAQFAAFEAAYGASVLYALKQQTLATGQLVLTRREDATAAARTLSGWEV